MPINKKSSGRGCPICSGKRVVKENSLETLRPDLVKRWHPTLNGEKSPDAYTIGSNEKVFWLCENNHTYLQKIKKRNIGQGCPICSRKTIDNSNCLATTNPELAEQWHPTLNEILTPYNVSDGYGKDIFWQCQKNDNHIFKAKPITRSTLKTGCPFCSNRQTSRERSLAFLYENVCSDWDYVKNNSNPDEFVPGSSIKVWWKCEKGHEELEQIRYRVRRGNCNSCNKEKRK